MCRWKKKYKWDRAFWPAINSQLRAFWYIVSKSSVYYFLFCLWWLYVFIQCLFNFCYSKRQRAKTTPQICFHVFLLVVRWFVLNANPFALAPTHQSNWIRYHMDSCCELWCARTRQKEKKPTKSQNKET